MQYFAPLVSRAPAPLLTCETNAPATRDGGTDPGESS